MISLSYKKKKNGVISIISFVLILLLIIIIFISSNNFYKNSKENIIFKNKNQEVLNSILTFRSDLINLVSKNNSNLIYLNNYDLESISIYLNNQTISGVDLSLNKRVEVNVSSLGLEFCSNYTFSPKFSSNFSYNGICISMITS